MGTSNNRLKKILIDIISTRLLGLEFESGNRIKSIALKYIVKNIARFCFI